MVISDLRFRFRIDRLSNFCVGLGGVDRGLTSRLALLIHYREWKLTGGLHDAGSETSGELTGVEEDV